MSESDGVNEAVGGAIRVAVTAGMLVAEQAARAREAERRAAQAESAQRAAETEARIAAERDTAVGQLAGTVDRPQWWQRASASDIGQAWETAATWRGESAETDRLAGVIGDQLEARYGIDPDRAGDVADAVDWTRYIRGEREPTEAERLREQAAADPQGRWPQRTAAGEMTAGAQPADVASAGEERTGPPPPRGPRDGAGREEAVDPVDPPPGGDRYAVTQQARHQLAEQFGENWASRTDLPQTVSVTTYERESEQYYRVQVQWMREEALAHPGRQRPTEQAKAKDQADLAASAPLLRDGPGKAVVPDVATLMRYDPGAEKARLGGVGDAEAVEARVLAGAHQARPAGQVPAPTGTARSPRPKARGAAAVLDPERGRGR